MKENHAQMPVLNIRLSNRPILNNIQGRKGDNAGQREIVSPDMSSSLLLNRTKASSVKMEGNVGYSRGRKRKYCCMCNNYRGQVVSGRKVTLHRFPLDENKRKMWIDCCKNALQSFEYSFSRLLCSEHFEDGNVPTKGPTRGPHPCPVFGEKFRKQMVCILANSFDGRVWGNYQRIAS